MYLLSKQYLAVLPSVKSMNEISCNAMNWMNFVHSSILPMNCFLRYKERHLETSRILDKNLACLKSIMGLFLLCLTSTHHILSLLLQFVHSTRVNYLNSRVLVLLNGSFCMLIYFLYETPFYFYLPC